MPLYADLAPCQYFGEGLSLLSVGWLAVDQPYEKGTVEKDIYFKLVEMCKRPWAPMAAAGLHKCELCVYVPEAQGGSNLFIPGEEHIFVCPGMITHYMNAHRYKPPAVFCEAVKRCPKMGTAAYFRALLKANGRALIDAGRRANA